MSVKLNRPPKPEESLKDSKFNVKTIPYPGFEPGTSGLAVGSHNHCTIWVGLFLLFLLLLFLVLVPHVYSASLAALSQTFQH
jgi:hypothetical protein